MGMANKRLVVLCLPLLVLFVGVSIVSGGNATHYRAAAAQFATYIVRGPPDSANVTHALNMAKYRAFATEAAAKGVDILVLPEGGLGWAPAEGPDDVWTRDDLSKFCPARAKRRRKWQRHGPLCPHWPWQSRNSSTVCSITGL